MEGAILISRGLLDSEVFASEKLLKIWIWMLIKATYKDRAVPIRIGAGQSTVELKRGQFLFGRMSAENELFIDGSTIYKAVKKLEALGNITIDSNSHYSIITICNYDLYQDISTYKVATKEQPNDSQVTGKEQPRNTNNKDNKDNKDNKEKNLLFQSMIEIYSTWIYEKFEIPPQINGQEGKAMKSIIAYIKKIQKAHGKESSDQAVVDAWNYTLQNYGRWDPFHQKQTKISQISSNLQNILKTLKHGQKPNQVSDGDLDRIISEAKLNQG